MRLSSAIVSLTTFISAGALCLVAASFLVTGIEDTSEIAVRQALDDTPQSWAEVEADGLQVVLSGTAPDEAGRFAAERIVGRVVDQARVLNQIDVAPAAEVAPPRFSAEILRNDRGISIIGLIPAETERDALIEQMRAIAGDDAVTDLLEAATYPVPDGWNDAMGFAVTALSRLPRSKVSVEAGRVSITAISDSAAAKTELEQDLQRAAPPGLRMSLDIAAPRPVITPFTLRYQIDASGGHFDACSAETEDSRTRILASARSAGLATDARCVVGMGVPSPYWAKAAELSMTALAQLGQGTITMADADITLVAAENTNPNAFDRVVGELEAALPEVFALHAVLPVPESAEGLGPPEFTATLSPEGLVQMRGRVNDQNLRHMADSYARARFGSENVYMAARLVSDLPMDWPVRVLAGLEALSRLKNGAVIVSPETLTVRGISEREDATAEVSRLFSDQLGETATYQLDITYRAPPPPRLEAPDPDICEAELVEIQTRNKITFEPGSDEISEAATSTMNEIAELLTLCGDIRLEIQGHTDSQGRTVMNQQLSQARAQSVLNELRARRVLTASYTAVGYGETLPIETNKTEEGREANRRIAFRLIRPTPMTESETTLDAIADENAPAATNSAEDGSEGSEN
ncbi:MAG: OmpA family protein [Sedimentitalea sp.]